MSSFEFITVLYAVIVGLAIAHLLTGLGRAIHHRASAPLWWVHMGWTIAIFFYITLTGGRFSTSVKRTRGPICHFCTF